ncbi:MAG: efflux transporter outer membrane subunit [Burkholderiales bacterium]|nr:efflux transporter outer membrane subunit [Burkholderiales bacterium]
MRVTTLKRWGLLAAAVAGLGGCAAPTPPLTLPAAPVAPAFPNAATSPQSGLKAASATGWQEYFPDPSLREVIGQALANNRDLRVAVLNIEAARAVLGQRRADLWPTLNAGASAVRGTGSNGNVAGTYTAGLTVSAWELDLFGRVRAGSDAAAAQLAASEEGRRAAQVALVASVAQAWLALCADDELLEIARNTVKSREQSLQLTQLRYQHGTASELDLRQAQSLAASARAALAQFTRQRELDLNALTLLVGQPLAVTPLPRIQSLVFAEVPTGLPSEVLLQRPDVRQAEQLLVAANANIGAARAAYWPRISLTGSLGTASTQLGDLFKDGAWSFAAQLLMPIFDAGRTESLVRGATAQRDIALAQYERAIQAAFRDVADALAGRATLVDQLRALEVQRQAEAARLQLVQVRVDNGVGTTLELLDAERSLFAAAQAEVQTRLAEQQSRIAMYRALGGGVQ